MESMTTELLVIGGGAAGLAAATAAAEKGVQTTVVEAMAAVGGNGVSPRRVRSGQRIAEKAADFCWIPTRFLAAAWSILIGKSTEDWCGGCWIKAVTRFRG